MNKLKLNVTFDKLKAKYIDSINRLANKYRRSLLLIWNKIQRYIIYKGYIDGLDNRKNKTKQIINK